MGRYQVAGEQQLLGTGLADFAHQKHAHDGRNESDFNFGVAKFGFGHGKSEVANGGQAAAAGQGMALHLPDNELFQGINLVEELHQMRAVLQVIGVAETLQLLNVGQVGPGAEHVAGRAQHDDFNGFIIFSKLEGLLELGHHVGVQGVALVGAIEGNVADAVLHVILNVSESFELGGKQVFHGGRGTARMDGYCQGYSQGRNGGIVNGN